LAGERRTSRTGSNRASTGRVLRTLLVLRHDPPSEPPVVKGVAGRFLDTDIEEAVRIARAAANGSDVVVLGANVAQQCLEAGLLDEIIVHIAPALLGDGVRFFERRDGAPVRLQPISSVVEGDTTVLHYRVMRV
jgi:dihydrofolate reductase